MILSVAQTKPVKGDIQENIKSHIKLIELAVAAKAAAIFFPELSITGYEPELAKELAIEPGDHLLDVFQEISDTRNITIGVGMPTLADAGIRISMILFQPGSPRQVYSKQELHEDEFPYFIKGEGQLIITVESLKIAPAICYESLLPEHAEKAIALGAELYLASVSKTQNGIEKAMLKYPAVAKRFSVPVLMANSVAYNDNFLEGGKSAIWNKEGELTAQLEDLAEGILLFDTEHII